MTGETGSGAVAAGADLNWREPWAERGAEITTENLGPGWDSRAAELAQAGSLEVEEL